MTAIVGLFCKDGVVIGADSSATFVAGGMRTIEQPTDKIRIIGDQVIVAGTGAIGLTQRLCGLAEKAWQDKAFKGTPVEIGKMLCLHAIQDFSSTGVKQGEFGAMIAFPVQHKPELCEFAVADFQPELKTDKLWYCSMGSGQLITDPFLGLFREVFWHDGPPSLQDGMFAVTWVLDQAIKLNPGGVNGPIQIAILEKTDPTKTKARFLSESELGQHRENVSAAKAHLRRYRDELQPKNSSDVPDVPKP